MSDDRIRQLEDEVIPLARKYATDEAWTHARWHRALDDPDTEGDNPIRTHIRAALAQAWDDGWQAHFNELHSQELGPEHPITRTNRYRDVP